MIGQQQRRIFVPRAEFSRISEPIIKSDIHLVTCVGVDFERRLLPYFLSHYLALGLSPFKLHVILHCGRPNSLELSQALTACSNFKVTPADIWIGDYTSEEMWRRRREIQRALVPSDAWMVSADVDEFHEFPASMPSVIRWCERLGVNCVQGPFIDRVATAGELAPIPSTGDLYRAFPIKADVQGGIGGIGANHGTGGTVKLMLMRGDVFPRRGGHVASNDGAEARYLLGRNLAAFPKISDPSFRFRIPVRVHHFKWHSNLKASLDRRLATAGVSAAGAEYGGKLQAYFAKHDGLCVNELVTDEDLGGRRLPWQLQVAAIRVEDILHRVRTRIAARGSA